MYNQIDQCDYFRWEIDDFGLLLKGASLDKLHSYSSEFDNCFIVSDYDDELEHIGHLILGKRIAHFTNRSIQAKLSKDNYVNYKINNIHSKNYYTFTLIQCIIIFKFNYEIVRMENFNPKRLS